MRGAWHFLDILLGWFHWLIVGFMMLGWLFPEYRAIHLAACVLMFVGWFVFEYITGYPSCFLTLLQWKIKAKVGETNLPQSFFTYYFSKWGFKGDPDQLNARYTLLSYAVFGLSLVINVVDFVG